MPAQRILVFPDCGPRIGGGHVMRCLTLARALTARGAAVAFAANPAAQAVLAAFGARDMTVFPVTDDLAEAMAILECHSCFGQVKIPVRIHEGGGFFLPDAHHLRGLFRQRHARQQILDPPGGRQPWISIGQQKWFRWLGSGFLKGLH